jgi:hypothetical protein
VGGIFDGIRRVKEKENTRIKIPTDEERFMPSLGVEPASFPIVSLSPRDPTQEVINHDPPRLDG